jgi:trans-AT polyketide synthase/acyltransferase/oxidoreductase domain-containing protein
VRQEISGRTNLPPWGFGIQQEVHALISNQDTVLSVSVGWREAAISQHPFEELGACLRRFREPVFIRRPGAVPLSGEHFGLQGYAFSPPLHPGQLGAAGFRAHHGVRYNYYAGSMANGIASESVVEAMGNAGMLGFFGAAGLPPARVESALERLTAVMQGKPWGCNLINSPGDPLWQERVADLYIQYGVPCVEASAYISLSAPLIKYRVTGIHVGADGEIVVPHRVIAKLSRVEVARRFLSPPPDKNLRQLVESGHITAEQAALAARIPMADDVTVEADSGGHTDHRPAITVLPSMLALRDELQAQFQYATPPRIGLGGGIGTPSAVAAAFQLGAAYVVTGSINQACVESGSSATVRDMLSAASQTDVGQAPAADMFEMGVRVQVLTKGTRFTTRGDKLFQVFKQYESIEEIPAEERAKIESEIFRTSLDEIWEQTVAFFEQRDPSQIEKALAKPRHKMALLFRWYLGQASRWANTGAGDRQEDYQIWCGPAMGAFNEWVKGTGLEPVAARHVDTVALQLLTGAAVSLRAGTLRMQGIPVPDALLNPAPLAADELAAVLA